MIIHGTIPRFRTPGRERFDFANVDGRFFAATRNAIRHEYRYMRRDRELTAFDARRATLGYLLLVAGAPTVDRGPVSA